MGEYSLFDFDKGKEIVETGRQKMEEALRAWSKGG
jgi:hypothetical protein